MTNNGGVRLNEFWGLTNALVGTPVGLVGHDRCLRRTPEGLVGHN